MWVPTLSFTALSLVAQCSGRVLHMSTAVDGTDTPITVSSLDAGTAGAAGSAVSILGPSPDVRFGDRIALVNLNATGTPAFLTTAGSISYVAWQRIYAPMTLVSLVREWVVESAGAPGSVAAGTPLAPGIQFKLVHASNPAASLAMRTLDATLTLGITSCSSGSPLQPLLVTFNRPSPALVLQPQPWWMQLVNEAIQLPEWWIEAWAPSWGSPPAWWRPHGHSAFKQCLDGTVVPAHMRCPAGPIPVPGCPPHWTKCPDGNCRPPGVRCYTGDCPPGQQWCAFTAMCQHVGTRCMPSPSPLPPPRPTPCPPGSKACPGGCCPFGAPCPLGQTMCNGHCQSGGIHCMSPSCPPGYQRCPDGKCQHAGTRCEGGGSLPFLPPTPCATGTTACPGGCCKTGLPPKPPAPTPSLGRVSTHHPATLIPTPFTPFGRLGRRA